MHVTIKLFLSISSKTKEFLICSRPWPYVDLDGLTVFLYSNMVINVSKISYSTVTVGVKLSVVCHLIIDSLFPNPFSLTSWSYFFP